MNVLRKRVGLPLEVVETNERYFLDCAKSFFDKGTTLERVYMDGSEFILVVDEDGLAKQLPLNFLLSFENRMFPVQMIVGDVVFIRNKEEPKVGEIYDWEVSDVTSEDIKTINNILSPDYQRQLRALFHAFCKS